MSRGLAIAGLITPAVFVFLLVGIWVIPPPGPVYGVLLDRMVTMTPSDDESKSLAALISEVVQLAKQVAVLNATFPSHVEWVERNVKDHEVRIRSLEQTQAKSAWIPALVTAIVTGVIVAGITALVVQGITG